MTRIGTIEGGVRSAAQTTAAAAGFTLFAALGTFATLVYPPAAAFFLAPALLAVAILAPTRASPRKLAMGLIYVGALTLPLWPVYLHLKLGPAPILTPPRLVLYALTFLWLYDMAVSPLRRGQFRLALRRGAAITAPVGALWLLGLLSLPLAEGRMIAAQEFFRQTTIWLAPFLAIMTYVRRASELRKIVALLTIAAAVSGAIALAELASGRLLAEALAPFIGEGADWLRVAQTQKIRDGVFRAQAVHTHPLSLGEFLSFAAPIALAFAIAARRASRRLAWCACLLLIVGGALATNSRGAMIAVAAALSVAGLLFMVRFLKSASAWAFRPAAGLLAALMLVASPAIFVGGYAVAAGKAGASAARSTQSRIDQIEQAWPKILKRPVGGYGTGRAARVLGYWGATLTVDNYYLNLALDYGFPGPIALGAILFAMGACALRRSDAGAREMRTVYVGLAAAALAFALTRTIVSQTGNLAILYLLLGAMAGAASGARPRAATQGLARA